MRLHLPTLAVASLLATFPAVADTLVYRGHLEAGHAPANGHYDLRLVAHGDAKSGNTLAAPMEFPAVPVVDGAFRVDFELPPGATEAWVELSVRAAGDSSWSTIPGRTKALAAPAAIGQCWSSSGDSGSNPATNFLGTTDAQPLVLRTRNVQSLRIEPSTILFGGNAITANLIAGSSANSVTAGVRGATIAGGGVPSGDSDPVFSSEAPNRVTDHFGSIGGGFNNQAGDAAGSAEDRPGATIGGGSQNIASGTGSTVAGGAGNSATGALYSTVGGGALNTASGGTSVVAGGFLNTASGDASTVGGGERNCAGAGGSWAGGTSAKVRPASNPGGSGSCSALTYPGGVGDQGTFVWADSQGANFVSTGEDQFNVRARGGVGINTAPRDVNVELTIRGRDGDAFGGNADVQLVVDNANREGIQFGASNGGSGSNDANFEIAHANGTAYAPRMTLFGSGAVTIRSNNTATNTGVTMAAGAGAWSSLSDRNVKTGVVPVDAADVLARVLELPLSTWRYLAQGDGIRHMGPMAQDFRAAFGLGENDTSISTIDADGVALAAIQGLNAKLEAENAALRSRIEALERAVLGGRAAAE
jgi:hypothetical protein